MDPSAPVSTKYWRASHVDDLCTNGSWRDKKRWRLWRKNKEFRRKRLNSRESLMKKPRRIQLYIRRWHKPVPITSMTAIRKLFAISVSKTNLKLLWAVAIPSIRIALPCGLRTHPTALSAQRVLRRNYQKYCDSWYLISRNSIMIYEYYLQYQISSRILRSATSSVRWSLSLLSTTRRSYRKFNSGS